MECPDCGVGLAAYPVPPGAREHAPVGTEAVAVCPRCFAVTPAGDPAGRSDTGDLEDAFPAGEPGGAMAIAVGFLAASVALNSDAILDLFGIVSDAGADPWLVLERLAADPAIAPDVDVDRAYRQLQQLS